MLLMLLLLMILVGNVRKYKALQVERALEKPSMGGCSTVVIYYF